MIERGKRHQAMSREAQALARKGRGGDTEVAHVALGEIVVPRALQNAEVMAALGRAAAARGLPLSRLTVGGANSVNPNTGAPEFGLIEDYTGLSPNGLVDDLVIRGAPPPPVTLPARRGYTPREEFLSVQNDRTYAPDGTNPQYDMSAQLDKNECLPGFRHVYADQASGISTINDEAGKPSPDRAINGNLAGLAEGFTENGLSLNMNSSTGGDHKGGAHSVGNAADFNRIGGRPVSSADAAPLIESFKSYLKQQPQTYKIIGPGFAIQSDGNGGWQSFVLSDEQKKKNLNHVHVETWPR